jgi:predicted dehydrogenase
LKALTSGEVLAFDNREDRRNEVKSQLECKVLETIDDAWTQSPDVAFITVPTRFHVPLAVQCAEQGCHLFIEKPLSDSLDGVDHLFDIVRKQNLVTLVGCNMRFHPGLRMIKRLLEEESIGQVVAIRVEGGQYLPDWHPWEDYRQGYSARLDLGGGVILDGIHELDYIRWILGEIHTVACFAGKLSRLEIETEDTAAILLRFTNFCIGEVHLDYVQRAYSRTCHIIGDQGTIRWNYTTGEVHWYCAAKQEWQVLTNPTGWEPNQMYLDEVHHFLKCLSGEEKSTLDVFEAKRVLDIALAAKLSAECGRIVELKDKT